MKETRNMPFSLVTIPPVQGPENEPESTVQIPLVTIPPTQAPASVEDEKPGKLSHLFSEGAWLPSIDPLAIGPKNFSDMQNLRYGEQCLEGVPGYSKINTTALSTYLKIRSGIQLTAPFTIKSRVLVQAYNTGLTASQVLQNKTAIPSQGDFEATALHTDAAGAGLGRFAKWPGNQIAYCNGKEMKIYGGDEIPCAAFITSTAAVTGAQLTNPKDFSEQVRNDLQTIDQVAIIGGQIDSYVKLAIHSDGAAASDITDCSPAAHGNATKNNGATVSIDHAKFGNGSISFPNYNSSISYGDHSDWDPAAVDFCIDFTVFTPSSLFIGANAEFLFTDGGGAADTIKLNGGLTWADCGFADGDTIYFKIQDGSGYNDKILFTIASGCATDNVTLSAADSVVNDVPRRYSVYRAKMLCSRWQDATHYWFLAMTYRNLLLNVNGTQTENDTDLAYGHGFRADTFSHVAIQYRTSGNSIAVYCNGYCRNTPLTTTLPDLAADLVFGAGTRGTSLYIDAKDINIDEIRVSKDRARYNHYLGATYNVPTRAYATAARTFLIGATRRLQAINLYIPAGRGNTVPSSLTGQEFVGAGWNDLTITSDTTKPGSIAIAQSGKVSFNSTVDTTVAKYIEGKVLHWYQFILSDGEAEIYQVTVDAPWQDVRDCWDGTEILLSGCLVYVAATTSYKDFTGEAADEAASTVIALNNLATTEHLILQSPVPLMGFNIRMSTDAAKVNANAAVMSIAYGNGEAIGSWPGVNGFTDGTAADGKSLKQTGVVSFSPVGAGQEFKVAINGGESMYSYKMTFSAQLSATVESFYITGIPAPQPIKPYIFPFMFLGRPMLCGYKAGGEGNRIDYGMANASDVHNGPDSSNGVDSEPLYIGGSADLTAACEVFNRLGSSIYSFAVLTKAYETHILNGYNGETYRSYPISSSLGNPAPLTMDTWQTSGTTADGQAFVRTIAMWISHQGPVMFDSAGLHIIPGLECYFDRRDSRCVNFAALSNARGWFDPDTGDYNVQLPSGSAQTTPNLWVALDLKKMRWYPVVPSAAASPYLGAAFRVADTTDKNYIYGARDNGYMMLLHDPATPKWDGTAAVQSVTLGDLVVSGDMWDKILLNFLKVFGISTTEDTDAAITHYKDGATAGTSLAVVALNGANRYFKDTQPVNISAWSHRIKISATITTEKKGLQLLGWGMEYTVEREDH